MRADLIAVRDFDRLAILDLHHIVPIRTEYRECFWAFFPREEASEILDAYTDGRLQVEARELVAAINRVAVQMRQLELTSGRGV